MNKPTKEELRFWESRLEKQLSKVKADVERDPYAHHKTEIEYCILLGRVRFEDVYLSEKYERKYEEIFE